MRLIVVKLLALLVSAVLFPSAADASFTFPRSDLPSMNDGGLPRTVKTEADGLTVVREFDAKGQLRFLKDRKGATFEFRYDELGRRTHVIVPGGAATVTAYKKNGRVASVTEPSGDAATFSYNSTTGRLSSVSYSGGATVNYTSYDASGNLLALNENGTNAITRTYDGLNRVTSYTENDEMIGYRYYSNGKLAKLIYPGGTENGTGHVEYLYNAEGRLWQVIDKLDSTGSPRITTYGWNVDGSLSSITRPNGTIRTITYDAAGRPSAIAESAGVASLLALGITYYPSDEIATLDVTPAPPIRKTKAIPAVAMTFDAANRVATFNGQSVGHDADGNMTSGPLLTTGVMTSYDYDSRNRLVGADGLTYTYNAEGNRVGISGKETTSLVIDPQGALPKVLLRTKNGVTTRYVYGVGLQYEVNSAGEATYYHYDQSGNTTMLTDAGGDVVDRITYSAYGTIRYRMENHDTPFLYGGFFGVMTDSNGLIAMRARYYNPLLKRFLTSDPAMDGLNWYSYANGNPINFADPTGYGAASVLRAMNSGLNYLGIVGSGFLTGLGQGLDNFNNTVTLGLYDHMGWSNSKANVGWEHDLSRSLATIPRDIVLGAGVAAAYQSSTRATASVVNSFVGRGEVTVYRVFGGDARAQGFSWTTVDPRTVSNFRNGAGLPSGGASGAKNTADFLIQGKVNPTDIIKSRSALPLDGNAGGLPELIINPKNVRLNDFSVLNP